MPTSNLVSTPGAADANSYVSLATADQYHLDRPAEGTTWADATVTEKTKALLWATKLLDKNLQWSGSVVAPTVQALLWPRYGMYDRRGNSIGSDVIPADLQEATAEYARCLLAKKVANDPGDTTKDQLEELAATARKHGVRSVSTPNISIVRDEMDDDPWKRIPGLVLELLPESWFTVRGATRELLRA